jgi:hypothetical protein
VLKQVDFSAFYPFEGHPIPGKMRVKMGLNRNYSAEL